MDLDECDKCFDEAISSRDASAFCYALEPLWKNYEILSIGLGRGSIFWRARIVNGDPYQTINELIYPPPKFSKTGRLNDEGQPCFYASSRKETALSELNVEEGQIVQLAGFRVYLEQTLKLAVVGEYSHVQKTGYIRLTGTDPANTINRQLNLQSLENGRRLIYIDKFFADILSDKNAKLDNYFKSRALSSLIYSRNHADGITFPSVKDDGGINIGIKPEAFDAKIHNVACCVVRVNKIRKFGVIEFELLQTAKNIDELDHFHWNEDHVTELFQLYGMTEDEYIFAKDNSDNPNTLLDVLSLYSSRATE